MRREEEEVVMDVVGPSMVAGVCVHELPDEQYRETNSLTIILTHVT